MRTMSLHSKNDLFLLSVYEWVARIPYGRVTSYGAIATVLGAKKGARMVGWCLSKGHLLMPELPYHRVVNRQGVLTGKHHFPTRHAMQQLLKAEGVEVKDDKVVSFDALFWDPQQYAEV